MTIGNKSRALIETVVITGVVIAIGLLVSRQAALKYLFGIVWSLSLLYYIKRYDLVNGLLVMIFSSAVVITLQGNLEVLLFLAQFIPVVILTAFIIKKQFSLGRGILYVLVICILINGILMLTTVNKTKADIYAWQSRMHINVKSYMKIFDQQNYDKLGIDRNQMEEALILDNKMIQQAVQLLPGILTLNYLFSSMTILILALWLYKGKKTVIPAFSTWHAPWYFIWLSIFGFGSIALGNFVDSHLLIILGLNVTFVIFPFLLAMGISVIVYFLKKWQPTTFTKVFLFFFILLSLQIVLMLIMLIGIFDPYFDFRKLNSTGEKHLGG